MLAQFSWPFFAIAFNNYDYVITGICLISLKYPLNFLYLPHGNEYLLKDNAYNWQYYEQCLLSCSTEEDRRFDVKVPNEQ